MQTLTLEKTKTEQLDEIGEEVGKIGRKTGDSVIKLGEYLIEAKSLCNYGEWEDWLTKYFNYSDRTAQRFMAMARELGHLDNLNLYKPTALQMLIDKDTPELIKEQMIALGNSGEPVTPAVIKEAIIEYNTNQEIDRLNDNLADLLTTDENDNLADLFTTDENDNLTDLFTPDKSFLPDDIKNFSPDKALAETRHLTAMTRTELSTPIRLALQHGYLNQERTHFDYGCGKAGDTIRLRMKGIKSNCYDPFFFPENPLIASDVVSLNYVLNVLENAKEREKVLRKAYQLAKEYLIIAVRTDSVPDKCFPYEDGHITNLGTFQKHFTDEEAINLLKSCFKLEDVTSLSSGIYVIGIGNRGKC